MTLRFDATTEDASWFTAMIDTQSSDDVALSLLLGPAGFDAYARVLALPDPTTPGQHESDIPDSILDDFPSDVDIVTRVLDVMKEFSTTPTEHVFALWDGWPYDPELPAGVRVDLARRRLWALARGAADDWVSWASADRNGGYPPAAVWPADHTWCVVYDVDSHYAGVSGDVAAIEALLDTPALVVQRAERTPDLLSVAYA